MQLTVSKIVKSKFVDLESSSWSKLFVKVCVVLIAGKEYLLLNVAPNVTDSVFSKIDLLLNVLDTMCIQS